MIKAQYGPSAEELVQQLLPHLVGADIQTEVAQDVILALKGLGYSITIEVEIHGDMAHALESLGGDTGSWEVRKRPGRR